MQKKSKPSFILGYNSHKSSVDNLDLMLKVFAFIFLKVVHRYYSFIFWVFCQASCLTYCLKYPHDLIYVFKNRKGFL